MDWIIADTQRGPLANASNMFDVTWEAPDGTITPLDGYLDPYFQEVCLEAESIPSFAKLAKQVAADAVDHYIGQLENEVRRYVAEDVNYGKVARRLYNIFRLNGQYVEAACSRELFDEPAAALCQGWALVWSLDEALHPGQDMALENLIAQADQLIATVINALEGEEEKTIVGRLMQLRDALALRQTGHAFVDLAETARSELIDIANDFFRDRLLTVPSGFYGGISTERTLPYGIVQEVRDEVRRLIDGAGNNGGYIAAPAHAIPADAKAKNIAAMIDVLQN